MRLMLLMLIACVGCGPYYLVSEVPSDTKLVSTPVETPQEKPDDLPVTDGCCDGDCQCCERCPCRSESTQQVKTVRVPDSQDPVTGLVVSNSTIVMQSIPGCQPCQLWWNQERPKWEASGWKIVKDEESRADKYPTFRIYERGRWYEHGGFMSVQSGMRLLAQ